MRRKSYAITVRFCPADYNAIRTKITKSHKTQQDYITAALIDGVIIDTSGAQALLPELKRQGNNLNQCARRLNQLRQRQYDAPQIEPILTELDSTLTALMDTYAAIQSPIVTERSDINGNN